MRVFTSYFAVSQKISDVFAKVSISRKGVQSWTYKYPPLYPTEEILKIFKQVPDEDRYRDMYYTDVLSKLNPKKVIMDLRNLVGLKDVVLFCYEKSGSFCHRHLVAEWLRDSGIPCSEVDLSLEEFKAKPPRFSTVVRKAFKKFRESQGYSLDDMDARLRDRFPGFSSLEFERSDSDVPVSFLNCLFEELRLEPILKFKT